MYRLAIDTTSRRFASISRCLPRTPSADSHSRSPRSASEIVKTEFSFSSAYRPASIDLASSTSSSAVSSGTRPISRR